MCTYGTQQREISGSAKGPAGWFGVTRATVYYDHPVHAFAEHTLNVDLAAPDRSPAARVALELTAESAVALVAAVADALTSTPQSLTGLTDAQLAALRSCRAVT